MKTPTIILLMVIFSAKTFAQSGEVYVFKYFKELAQCDVNGNWLDASGNITTDENKIEKHSVEAGWKFIIANQTAGKTIIKLLKFTNASGKDSDEKEKNLDELITTYNQTAKSQVFFLLRENELETNAVLLKSKWDFSSGALTLPMKIRTPKDSIEITGQKQNRELDILGELNVGASFGPKIRFGKNRDFSVNTLFGFSLAGISVDASTTNGKVTEPGTELLGVTFHGSVVFEIKDFQIVIANGFDILGREVGENWIYQKGHWLGIGLGINIFNVNPAGSN
ncbi:MAG: hypothetical protein AAF502_18030 [Bacteroidota bacterium]